MKKYVSISLIAFIGCFFFSLQISRAQQKIIKSGDDWLYYDGKELLNANWMSSDQGVKLWKTGISPLGYGDDIVRTEIGFGEDPNKKQITKFFKKSFRIENPFNFLMYKLNVQRDDGIVIYLNGYEIWRNNMPQGVISGNTKATNLVFNTENEVKYITKILSPEDFVYGMNTISASVHQARAASSDCLFNLELIGTNNPEMLPVLLKEHSTQNVILKSKIEELNHKLETEKSSAQLDFMQHEKKTLWYALLILISILILLIVYVFYIRINLFAKEKMKSKQIRVLKSEINDLEQEMMSNSMNALSNQQYLKDLKKFIEKSYARDGRLPSKKFEKIISKIDFILDHDDDWINLKKHFNVIHTGFFDKLNKLHPLLSESEIRHCVFMKLHMHTKEIARLMNIDPKSVQTSRYRLKKKMNLDENVDLKEYLQRI